MGWWRISLPRKQDLSRDITRPTADIQDQLAGAPRHVRQKLLQGALGVPFLQAVGARVQTSLLHPPISDLERVQYKDYTTL